MCKELSGVERVVTSTTRPPRPNETDREDYYFFSKDEFEKLVSEDAFYEHAQVHANYYGTLKSEIREKLNRGVDLLLNIDVQGAATIREQAKNDPELAKRLVSVFVAPESRDELLKRLSGRGDKDQADVQRRMETAEREMQEWAHYDYFILSQSRDADFAKLQSIYEAEKARVIQ